MNKETKTQIVKDIFTSKERIDMALYHNSRQVISFDEMMKKIDVAYDKLKGAVEAYEIEKELDHQKEKEQSN